MPLSASRHLVTVLGFKDKREANAVMLSLKFCISLRTRGVVLALACCKLPINITFLRMYDFTP